MDLELNQKHNKMYNDTLCYKPSMFNRVIEKMIN